MEIVENKGVLSLKGEHSYLQPVYKTVVVDGETYTNRTCTDVIFKPETEKVTKYYDIDILPLGLTYKISRYSGWDMEIYRLYGRYSVSTNIDVGIYQTLFNNKLLDDRIIYLHAGKGDHYAGCYYGSIKESILHDNSIDITLFRYGFNNILSITIKMKDFILIKDKKAKLLEHDRYSEFFSKYLKIDIDKVSDINFAKALLHYKAKNNKAK